MSSLKRMCIVLLVFALIFNFMLVPAVSVFAEDPTQNLGSFTLVPIDNRPFPLYNTVKVGQLAGYKANTPNKTDLGRYFIPGNTSNIVSWLKNDVNNTLASVVAVDMLAYGGLINSRYYDGLTYQDAASNISVLETAKTNNPNKKIYAFNAIMRLATSPYRSGDGLYAVSIRDWSIAKDIADNFTSATYTDPVAMYPTYNDAVQAKIILKTLNIRTIFLKI